MTAFRMRSQIVDPEADLAGQMGVLSGLQAQLAEVLVAHDLLLDNAQPTDHRVTQSQQKIDALRRLIDAERAKFGAEGKGPAGESYAQLMAEYEKLAVDREFAEGAIARPASPMRRRWPRHSARRATWPPISSPRWRKARPSRTGPGSGR